MCYSCGVGGHGAALHARAEGLKTAVFSGKDVGGTCVNRGCVPSKALLAAAGRVRDMKNAHHLKVSETSRDPMLEIRRNPSQWLG